MEEISGSFSNDVKRHNLCHNPKKNANNNADLCHLLVNVTPFLSFASHMCMKSHKRGRNDVIDHLFELVGSYVIPHEPSVEVSTEICSLL